MLNGKQERLAGKILIICLFLILYGIFCTIAQAADFVSANITAQNTFTDAITPTAKGRSGYLNISVSGTWVGTVTLQRRYGSSGTYFDVITWSANVETALQDREFQVQYRLGIKTGEFTSGTAVLRLGREVGH